MIRRILAVRWTGRAVTAVSLLFAGAFAIGSYAHAASPGGRTQLVYVGTQQARIYALRFDPSTGSLAAIGPVAKGINATWVESDPRRPVIYAVDDDKSREGSVTAYAADRETGALTELNRVDSAGRGTTHLSLDMRSRTLLAASYDSGTVSSITLEPDGSLGARASTVRDVGSGPNVRRQASAHAHNAVVDPSGRYVLVPDLGADRVFVYGFDAATRALLPDDADPPRTFSAPAGSGPRHLVFGLDGRFAYLITELSGEIFVLRWEAAQGRLAAVQTVPLGSASFGGTKSGAEIVISGDGRFVYAQDRAEDTLVVYRVDRDSGELSELQRIASGGARPWGMALDPSGRWLFVANQHSGNVAVFSVDPASGKLAATGATAEVPTAVSVAFVR
ncbi:lactonase family protein [Burkholderia multivorans]|uniref:lactonase family protein n=1 Tax=Burkholderia multivorans TaxID=87883 RepID=UPI000CFE6B05|nr:lactonase family protein [Burkholderia multivorans]MBR8241454.1 lactonase family protein [Burkholderia multivorans]MDN7943023.1 lactonase family protein [Burkholderia multivorans]MDR9174719.1 6-phosphogluconolactonase [Burkholderia multivorans]MDR9180824.1 6-phosphogluconolactonase [Burkholderia multivorans]MDR9187534.1 6-phosphogluconolactonase [Burkholderia multivorans]